MSNMTGLDRGSVTPATRVEPLLASPVRDVDPEAVTPSGKTMDGLVAIGTSGACLCDASAMPIRLIPLTAKTTTAVAASRLLRPGFFE
jgi:hypothetical protein